LLSVSFLSTPNNDNIRNGKYVINATCVCELSDIADDVINNTVDSKHISLVNFCLRKNTYNNIVLVITVIIVVIDMYVIMIAFGKIYDSTTIGLRKP
jgi:hypothetical protein